MWESPIIYHITGDVPHAWIYKKPISTSRHIQAGMPMDTERTFFIRTFIVSRRTSLFLQGAILSSRVVRKWVREKRAPTIFLSCWVFKLFIFVLKYGLGHPHTCFNTWGLGPVSRYFPLLVVIVLIDSIICQWSTAHYILTWWSPRSHNYNCNDLRQHSPSNPNTWQRVCLPPISVSCLWEPSKSPS